LRSWKPRPFYFPRFLAERGEDIPTADQIDAEADWEHHLAESDSPLLLEGLGLEIGKIPTLKVVRLDSLLLHNEPDS
jgi:hypothetical protein